VEWTTSALTLAEVTQIVLDRYSLPANVVLVIEDIKPETNWANRAACGELIAAFNQVEGLDEAGKIRSDRKIVCIKALRDVYARRFPNCPACSLAMAKYAVEDWNRFSNYLRTYGWPAMTGDTINGLNPWLVVP
jgi:hypothetical protein